MRYLKYVGLLGLVMVFAGTAAHAQVRVGVGIGVGPGYIGPAPVCTYGYYDYYPYACAPYGYYGPNYFVDGVFIGAGPWFHGFRGRAFFGPGFRPFGRDFDRGFRGREGFRDFRGGPAFRGSTPFRAGNQFRGGAQFRGNSQFRGGSQFRGNVRAGGSFRGGSSRGGGGRR